MKRFSLSQLRKKESELYRRVEDLRYTLYLHHHSPLYQLYKMHAEFIQDITRLFKKKTPAQSRLSEKQKLQQSIHHLNGQLVLLMRLERSPYMMLIQALREIKWSLSALWYRIRSFNTKLTDKLALQSHSTYVIFGSCTYTKEQSRGVQIARALAARTQVVYVEPEFQSGYKPGFTTLPILPTLTVVRLKKNKQGIGTSLTKCIRTYRKKGESLRIIAMSPSWEPHLKKVRYPIVYDRPHSHISLPSRKATHSMAPHKKMGAIVVPNGVEMGAFADASKTIQTCDVGLCWIKKPVIGYIGDMDERIDEHAIGAIAKAFPKATVVLVGNTNYRPVIAVSEQHENIFPVGEQPYKNLSLYLQSFDILILPIKATCKFPLTHESLPMLLSSGKPIVTIATNAVAKSWKKILYLAKNHTTLIKEVKRALAESKKSKKRALRISQARKMRWDVNNILTLDS